MLGLSWVPLGQLVYDLRDRTVHLLADGEIHPTRRGLTTRPYFARQFTSAYSRSSPFENKAEKCPAFAGQLDQSYGEALRGLSVLIDCRLRNLR
jgi:hypothetical protein